MLLSSVKSTDDSSKFMFSFFSCRVSRVAGPLVYDLDLINSILVDYCLPLPPLIFFTSFFLLFRPLALVGFSLIALLTAAGCAVITVSLALLLLVSDWSPKFAVRLLVSPPRFPAFTKLILLSYLSIGFTIELSTTFTAASAIADDALCLRTVNCFIRSIWLWFWHDRWAMPYLSSW